MDIPKYLDGIYKPQPYSFGLIVIFLPSVFLIIIDESMEAMIFLVIFYRLVIPLNCASNTKTTLKHVIHVKYWHHGVT